jgi:NADH dehydrogenase subunit C (EC 1.6.5.3)
MADIYENLIANLRHQFEDAVLEVSRAFLEVSLTVECAALPEILAYLRDHKEGAFKQLIDVCGVDYLGREKRFEVVYHLLSYKFNKRIRIKVHIDEEDYVPSVSKIFSAANWYEREVWDLFGIKFSDHPDLRRLLTDYDFAGHPLRKDFPLSGFVEPRYDEEAKRVVYGPVNLPQEFRNFDTLSPWEGMTPQSYTPLPGDEKADGAKTK